MDWWGGEAIHNGGVFFLLFLSRENGKVGGGRFYDKSRIGATPQTLSSDISRKSIGLNLPVLHTSFFLFFKNFLLCSSNSEKTKIEFLAGKEIEI